MSSRLLLVAIVAVAAIAVSVGILYWQKTHPSTNDARATQDTPQGTSSAPTFTADMFGTYVLRSDDLIRDSLAEPALVNTDLNHIPDKPATWIAERRPLFEACARDSRVPAPIRLKVVALLLETALADPSHLLKSEDRLRFEGYRFNAVAQYDYAFSMRALVESILRYSLPRDQKPCLEQLASAGWQVSEDDVAYALTNLVPSVQVKP